ncbi:MAG: NADH-quinone oxidoreductase subunit NuoH [Candidatus Altarchaeaceae archaeon]
MELPNFHQVIINELNNFGIYGGNAELITYAILALILFLIAAVIVLVLTYLERKIIADVQNRLGPMVAGWHGILQPIADTLKLLFKEDIRPRERDKFLYFIAPILVFVPTFLMLTVIPFDKNFIFADVPTALLIFIAISGIGPLGILIAGYSSGNKYALLSSLRSAAQMMSYEIPIVIVALSVVILSGSLSIVEIVEKQSNLWFVIPLFIGFFVFLVASIAEMGRVPFDTIEAESELVCGYNTEYSGMRFAFFYLAEYLHLFIGSAIIVLLFFGGWKFPILDEYIPGILIFFAKTFALVYLAIWIRGTLPRFRIDQVLNLGWKILIPLSLLNLGIAGIVAFAMS